MSGDRAISRVRAVVAKALIAVDRTRTGRSRACLVVQSFNMRKRTEPPLPAHSCGNFVLQSVNQTMSGVEAEGISVRGLVDILGEAIEKATSDCSRILSVGADPLGEIVMDPIISAIEKSTNGEANAVWFTDWTKFGFSRTNFRWGKPVLASIGPETEEIMTFLMESE